MILAGEVSGDTHAAALVSAIRARLPAARFFGFGGDAMQAQGVELRYHVRDLAVMGFVEVIRHLAFFRRVMSDMKAWAAAERPDAVILVDYPAFNLRFAESMHKRNIRTIYYICPKVWAWKPSRIPRMIECLDHLITILPFETSVFAGSRLPVAYVGNPLVDEIARNQGNLTVPLPWDGEPRIGLLPGSRRSEIKMILPLMLEAAVRIETKHPSASFVIPTPNDDISDYARLQMLSCPRKPKRLAIVQGHAHAVMHQSRAALIASGTATLEASLLECPHVLTYRTSILSFLIIRMLIRVKHVGLVNLIADHLVSPELLQFQATPDALASALDPLIGDTPERRRMLEEMKAVNALLGEPGVADRAAQAVLDTVALTNQRAGVQ
jgi:lipid-A-disaccharide synthase